MQKQLQNIIKLANANTKQHSNPMLTPIIIDTQGMVNNKVCQTIGNAINNYIISKAKDFYDKIKPETVNKNPYWINNLEFFKKEPIKKNK